MGVAKIIGAIPMPDEPFGIKPFHAFVEERFKGLTVQGEEEAISRGLHGFEDFHGNGVERHQPGAIRLCGIFERSSNGPVAVDKKLITPDVILVDREHFAGTQARLKHDLSDESPAGAGGFGGVEIENDEGQLGSRDDDRFVFALGPLGEGKALDGVVMDERYIRGGRPACHCLEIAADLDRR